MSVPLPPGNDPWVLAPASPASLAVLESDQSVLISHIAAAQAVAIYKTKNGGLPPLISTVCKGAWDRSPWCSRPDGDEDGMPATSHNRDKARLRGLPRDMEEWELWQNEAEPSKELPELTQSPDVVTSGDLTPVKSHGIASNSRQSTLVQGSFGARSSKPGLVTKKKDSGSSSGNTGGAGHDSSGEPARADVLPHNGSTRRDV